MIDGQSSDIWAVGVVLYELSALTLPFDAKSMPQLLRKIIGSEPDYGPLKVYNPQLVQLVGFYC